MSERDARGPEEHEKKSALIAEADAEGAGGAHQGAVRIDSAGAANHFFQRHVDHGAVPPADHAVGLARGQQIDRADAERGGKQAVLRRGLGAALDVAGV